MPLVDFGVLLFSHALDPTAPDSTMIMAAASRVVDKVNVRVAVRCRPLIKGELGQAGGIVIGSEHNSITVNGITYSYDKLFGPCATQQAVYTEAVLPVVDKVLEGHHGTVFAYGQTSTGKTYTMQGELSDAEHMGVIPRSVHTIFEHLEALGAEFSVRVSFYEIYNEQLTDLLVDASKPGTAVKGPAANKTAIKLQRVGGLPIVASSFCLEATSEIETQLFCVVVVANCR